MAEVWVSMPQLEELIGRDAARTLSLLHGGVPVYVPQMARPDSKLTALIGLNAARVLATAFGGESITVPNGRRADPFKPRIITALEAGRSPASIALELGVTERHVRTIAGQIRPRARQLSLL